MPKIHPKIGKILDQAKKEKTLSLYPSRDVVINLVYKGPNHYSIETLILHDGKPVKGDRMAGKKSVIGLELEKALGGLA